MDSDDFPGVEVAYHAMVDVSEYINETKRDSELLTIIKEIQQSITEWAPNAGIGTSRQKVSLIVKVIDIIRDERPSTCYRIPNLRGIFSSARYRVTIGLILMTLN